MCTTEWIGDLWPPLGITPLDWATTLDLHGNHSPMAHHCMLKETHTISYIQQASHEWIEGDEEETPYTQATKSLRVVPIDIQHRPKVL